MVQESDKYVKPPTFAEIVSAPEEQWRQLATLADADIAFCERARARRAQAITRKPKRTRRRSQGRSRNRRNQTAASVYSRQIANATIEALTRINGGNSDV